MASQACCDAGAAVPQEEIKSTGQVEEDCGMRFYVAGNKGEAAIHVLYDIFGFETIQTRVFCDMLASSTGMLVVMPDHFRGNPVDFKKSGPEFFQSAAFQDWWKTVASADVVKQDIEKSVTPFLQKKGVKRMGAVGLCWGGLMSLSVLAADSRYSACGAIHGARLSADHAVKAKCPLMICPAGNDPHYDELKTVLDKREELKDKCVYKYYKDEIHGFCAARGDWKNARTFAAVQDAIAVSTGFFKANL